MVNRNACAVLSAMVALAAFACQAPCRAEEPAAVIPYGTSHTIWLKAEDKPVLEFGGFFKATEQAFGMRRLAVTINGEPVRPSDLLSPQQILRPRAAVRYTTARVDEEGDGTVRFPMTHRKGGLADWTYAMRGETDVFIPLYRQFPEVVYFGLSRFPEDARGGYRIRIYNSVDGLAWHRTTKTRYAPDFALLRCDLVDTAPPTPDDAYVPPVWVVLANHADAAVEAAERLADTETDKRTRAQLAKAFGLLHAVQGNDERAGAFYRQALGFGVDFPGKSQVQARMLIMGLDPGVDALDEATERYGWARLFNVWKAAQAGETHPDIQDVPRTAAGLDADGEPKEALWTAPAAAWRGVTHVVKGKNPSPIQTETRFAYDDQFLYCLCKGPASTQIRQNNYPGTDRPVWEWNCAELFVAPRGRITTYYELNVSSANARFDGRHHWNRVAHAEWNGAWESGVSKRDGVVYWEYRVPWSDFGLRRAPKKGEQWLALVVRVQHLYDEEKGWTSGEFSTPKLRGRNFHRLQDGMVLRFE